MLLSAAAGGVGAAASCASKFAEFSSALAVPSVVTDAGLMITAGAAPESLGSMPVGELRVWQPLSKNRMTHKIIEAEFLNGIGAKACCYDDKTRKLKRFMLAEQL
jgi:hypothetical protein